MNDKKITWEQAVLWLREQPDKQQIVRECFYDDPIEDAAKRFYQSEEWHAVNKLLSHKFPCAVLDLGAGRGISSFAFAKSGCNVIALEPDTSPIVGSQCIQSLFEKTGLSVTIVNDFGEKLPFQNDSFDIVYGRAVLHHAKDLPTFCNEVARVLKKRGLFLFTREHVISRKEDLAKFLNVHVLHYLYKGENAYLLSEYKKAIVKAGLKTLKTYTPLSTPINYYPLSEKQLQLSIRAMIQKRLGSLFANSETFVKTASIFYKYFDDITSKIPGRLYSFLAVK
jgi:ubiquinone/menaquinone biosynthesis C-methylase UbiE